MEYNSGFIRKKCLSENYNGNMFILRYFTANRSASIYDKFSPLQSPSEL